MRTIMFLLVFCCAAQLYSQSTIISGSVKGKGTKTPVHKAIVTIDGFSTESFTGTNGHFTLETSQVGDHILKITALDFIPKSFAISLNGQNIDLGEVFLEKDIVRENTDNLIVLTDGELSDDEETVSGSSGILQSSKDIFLNRAAFDFGQAFFKVRGYDSNNGQVLLNGIPMNKFYDGRPQWNNWGGLNDVIRNQEFTNGLSINTYTFGGILGNTNIDTRPSGLRPGIRISGSMSNRSYRSRLMATYSSGFQKNGLAYTFSSSRRWSNTGYVEGTLYDAYSFFGSLEYKLNDKNSLVLTSILARNRRGRSAAITEEVFDLLGNQYNPYWGNQDGEKRNSREREIFEPLFMLNHFLQSKKLIWTSGIAYQTGTNTRSRLGYYNAPNPDPTYYRYLPSFYINSSIGANFNNASLAKEGFLKNPQVQWSRLYTANLSSEGKAAYLLYDDVVKNKEITFSSVMDYNINEHVQLGVGGNFKKLSSENFAEIQDLLGASFHEDIDSFSNTLNDVNGSSSKTEGEKFNYHYSIDASQLGGFCQIGLNFKRWKGFVSGSFSSFGAQRNGLFQNERFLENSFGNSEKVSFSSLALKSGITYFFSGRHWLTANSALVNKPPTLQNMFINPRENNDIVPEIQTEKNTAIDLSYFIRLPDLTGRVSVFYTRFQNTTDINFFFCQLRCGVRFCPGSNYCFG
ncbi:TonB-dependent receptor [Flagellimonas sp. CMM7]|uniref:TonB-dependent receptor n=1 Tax=Flagellimonas sp. CMM7 TaxID=2654676 RepID=UPI001F3220EB|nr:TonB-dependent receptor [Flagellimonas sp. CMM7]UII81840.1 TonB-dependent receptor [Flagellimonas sp. CMM7]